MHLAFHSVRIQHLVCIWLTFWIRVFIEYSNSCRWRCLRPSLFAIFPLLGVSARVSLLSSPCYRPQSSIYDRHSFQNFQSPKVPPKFLSVERDSCISSEGSSSPATRSSSNVLAPRVGGTNVCGDRRVHFKHPIGSFALFHLLLFICFCSFCSFCHLLFLNDSLSQSLQIRNFNAKFARL